MKFLKLFLVFSLLLSNEASAAPIKVTQVKPSFYIPTSTTGDQINNLVTTPISIVVGGTFESTTAGVTTGYLAAFDWQGVKQWEFNPLIESIGSDLSRDNSGNLYLYGAAISEETTTSTISSDTATLNPDNVQVDPTYAPKNELRNLVIWKVSSSGQLLAKYSQGFPNAFFPKRISFDGKNFLLTGYSNEKYFEIKMDSEGNFGKPIYPKENLVPAKPQEYKFGTNKLIYTISRSPIPGIPSWKPKRPISVLITKSKGGMIKSANYFAEKEISTAYQRNMAFVFLSESTLGFGISIVRPLS